VHPGAGWSFTYRYHIQQLRNQFRCIALDFSGYSLSEARDGYGSTLLEQAKVLERFVGSLNLRNIVVSGNDGGGPTVILALADHTDRVSGLVVGGDLRLVDQTLPDGRMALAPLHGPNNASSEPVYQPLRLANGIENALGIRILSKAERAQYTEPFKERDSRNRTSRLYSSFMDPATQDVLTVRCYRLDTRLVLIPVWRQRSNDCPALARTLGQGDFC
jgi:pimeloyl-ACP methyl ester carboxylesterase